MSLKTLHSENHLLWIAKNLHVQSYGLSSRTSREREGQAEGGEANSEIRITGVCCRIPLP
jgi:hypothetical protein